MFKMNFKYCSNTNSHNSNLWTLLGPQSIDMTTGPKSSSVILTVSTDIGLTAGSGSTTRTYRPQTMVLLPDNRSKINYSDLQAIDYGTTA